MTEITDKPAPLAPAIERFVLHWGDMGGQWGVNRSISQIHALLYLSERPLTAEEIAEALGLARSNVSHSIKELLSWDLIRRVPVRGDRREHFEAETDVWEMFIRIAAGRKEREIDPAIAALKFCLSAADRQNFSAAMAGSISRSLRPAAMRMNISQTSVSASKCSRRSPLTGTRRTRFQDCNSLMEFETFERARARASAISSAVSGRSER